MNELISLNEITALLLYTPERYEEYSIGSRVDHFGRTIQIVDRRLRPDLEGYFEIDYVYVS